MTAAPSPAMQAPASDPLRAAVLVDAQTLAAELQGLPAAAPPVVLVVRASASADSGPWSLTLRIPSAIDTCLPTDFAAASHPTAGSRPLPDIGALQQSARGWGLQPDSRIVVYDHDGGLQAARAWWVLRWAGFKQVRLLDGGFAAWERAGLPCDMEAAAVVTSDIVLTPGHMPQLDADAAQALARHGLLLDSRIRPNYDGGPSTPGEPPRGHIPGAVSLPAGDNLNAAGAFLGAAQLRALYAAAGVDASTPVGVYCGAGVSAAHDILALASIGVTAPMYVGSWSAWSADPSRPVARGPEPG